MIAEAYQSTTTRLTGQELGACTLIEDLLPLYIEGEVSPASRDLIVEHLARCERCAGFLAGAQSVRAQLRRDGAQHAAVITNRLPEQRVVVKGQWLAVALAVLACCAVGSVGSALVWNGLGWGDVVEVFGGGAVVAVAFGLLLTLASMRAPLVLWRVVVLALGCGLGALAMLPLVTAGDEPGAVVAAMLLAILGFIGVWMAVWTRKAQIR
ncbi:MAG: zf-HC2 domain-containing protein [Chloroflexales bacterium]|nr:zf-HC2 domain-containing protein [Chloroflexales bacterium]